MKTSAIKAILMVNFCAMVVTIFVLNHPLPSKYKNGQSGAPAAENSKQCSPPHKKYRIHTGQSTPQVVLTINYEKGPRNTHIFNES